MKKRRIDGNSKNYKSPNAPTPLKLSSDGLIGYLCYELVLTILSYCDAGDLLIIRQCSPLLRKSSKDLILRSNALYLSILASRPVKKKQAYSVAVVDTNKIATHEEKINKSNHKKILYLNHNKQEEYITRIFQEASLKTNNKEGNHKDATINILQHLDLSNLRHISGATIFQFIPSESLVTLDLSGCSYLNEVSLISCIRKNRESPDDNQYQFPVLQHLYISSKRIGNDGILSLIRNAPNLETLHIASCSQRINDATIIEICQMYEGKERSWERQFKSLNLQGLNHLTDVSSVEIFTRLKGLQYLNVHECEKLRWSFLTNLGAIVIRHVASVSAGGVYPQNGNNLPFVSSILLSELNLDEQATNTRRDTADIHLQNLQVLNLSLGVPKSSIQPGVLGYLSFLSMNTLREVDISGCEHVQDTDIEVLASCVNRTLQSLEMRCCNIGNSAIQALAKYQCHALVSLDVSACFNVSDEGIIALCPKSSLLSTSTHTTTNMNIIDGCHSLTSLKIASLHCLTDAALLAIAGCVCQPTSFNHHGSMDYDGSRDHSQQYLGNGGLTNLLLLDLHDCPLIHASSVRSVIYKCIKLIELDIRGIVDYSSCLNYIRKSDSKGGSNLAILNGKKYQPKISSHKDMMNGCCTALQSSQRLRGVQPQRMYHCIECNLLPSFQRGFCGSCAEACHHNHKGVFLSSITTFYCDCAYGFSPCPTQCAFTT